jgi:hypothetical protein
VAARVLLKLAGLEVKDPEILAADTGHAPGRSDSPAREGIGGMRRIALIVVAVLVGWLVGWMERDFGARRDLGRLARGESVICADEYARVWVSAGTRCEDSR